MIRPPDQIDLLSKMLDAAELRHRVIAQNVANANTPGYRRQEVRFEDALAHCLEHGGERAVKGVQPSIVDAGGEAVRPDGNTVDMDEEMGQLNKNAILYKIYAQLLATQISSMRSAITGKQ
jgi:flagellar basal-body rod protein FlgB